MVLIESTRTILGSKAPNFSLKGVDERLYGLEDFREAKILVIVFMCNHCPYVQACIERLVVLQSEFADMRVRFIGINSNDSTSYPEDSFEGMRVFSMEKHMNFPYLHDEKQHMARDYGAVCTPDIFVFDRERMLRYHGRIDNNWKDPAKASSHELKNALLALVERRDVGSVQHPSMGCSIKWKE